MHSRGGGSVGVWSGGGCHTPLNDVHYMYILYIHVYIYSFMWCSGQERDGSLQNGGACIRIRVVETFVVWCSLPDLTCRISFFFY